MTAHFSKLKNPTLLTKCLVTLSGALVLSAAATRAEAATFQVDYKGKLDSITLLNSEGEDQTNLLSQPTSIVGNYTWEDVNRSLLSSNFKFLADNGDVIKDVTFVPGPPTYGPGNNYESYAEAGEDYATYLEELSSPAGSSIEKLRIDSNEFIYFQSFNNGNTYTIYQGGVDATTTLIEDPTSVPEPAAVLGLLVLAGGAGVSLQRRKSVARA